MAGPDGFNVRRGTDFGCALKVMGRTLDETKGGLDMPYCSDLE